MIGLIMLGSIANYPTRSTLAVAAPTVLRVLGITEKQYWWILGAFPMLGVGFPRFVESPQVAIALLSLAGFAEICARFLAHTLPAVV